ncbi:17-beta-hydroxysteroid dehydrogenase 13 isoform X1 [Peromyscus californicus insignis]|uniref:17-beta-hydroxysteroid dehydrogenase 13 isoform X1 n=1 Tax=Peromyscus californicus insignis TaxID=564181 RepID=UPI0022A7FDA7|nr:17-beta-hydroxysteroid dehydrogenase 13 isoform X1 [Peromyscus californicus insignis]
MQWNKKTNKQKKKTLIPRGHSDQAVTEAIGHRQKLHLKSVLYSESWQPEERGRLIPDIVFLVTPSQWIIRAVGVDKGSLPGAQSRLLRVKKEVGDVEIVVNNAGAIYPADLLSTKDEEITKTFEVNILGHFWIIKALLPSMLRRNSGHIVTVASVCGHGVIPYLIPYCSSKFAAVGFHRALTAELETLGKTGIKTSCLCPVFVNTGFTKNPSTRLWPVLETSEVARSLIDGILTNKKMIFVPSYINISLVLEKFLPERALKAISRIQNIQFEAIVGHKTKMK